MGRSGRPVTLGVLGLLALLASRCQDDAGASEILLTITSTADVDAVEILARNIDYDEDVIVEDLEGRSIVAEPLEILIQPSSIAVTGGTGFLVVARGTVGGSIVVSGRKELRFVPMRRVEET